MGLDECSYARHMRGIMALMDSLPPGWEPTSRARDERPSRPREPARPGLPGPRRPTRESVERVV
jgi:hypothetical protein